MTFDFMGKRFIAAGVSGALLVVSVLAITFWGVNRGLDFTSGTLVEFGFAEPIDPDDVRELLVAAGFEDGVVQNYGSETDLLVRMPPIEPAPGQANAALDSGAGPSLEPSGDPSGLGERIADVLEAHYEDVELRRAEFVGPKVGAELTEKGGLALLVSLGAVMLYIMWRFMSKFGVGAVAALVHDVLLVVGAFAVFQWTFNLAELAALLAVIGYSLNDTIVVSDRIRENFRTMRRGSPVEIINHSLNQTLGRTLVTSLTTLLVLLCLLVAGGEQIAGFATALVIGIVVGTYSSIYVAANVLLAMGITKQDLALPEKEEDALATS